MIRPSKLFPFMLVFALVPANADEEESLEATMKSIAGDLQELNILFDPGGINMGDVYKNFSDTLEVYDFPDEEEGTSVELQGGEIRVTGERPDAGGTFWYAIEGGDSRVSVEGWVTADELASSLGGQAYGPMSVTVSDYLEEKIMEKIRTIKEKYDNNPHLYVDGFSLTAGVPPSATVTFSFREKAPSDRSD